MRDGRTEKTKLEKKFAKQMGKMQAEEYVQKFEAMSKEQLEQQVLDYAKTQQGIINSRNADGTLDSLKARVKEISRTYNDQLRGNKEKTRFISLLISEKFGDELMDIKTQTEDEE